MSQRAREREQQRRSQRRLWRAGLATAAIVVLVAAGVVAFQEGDPDESSVQGTRVAMREYEFDPDPIVLDAAAVKLEVVNEGTIPHNLLLPQLGKGAPDLDAGGTFTLELEDVEPGTYSVICDLPGHREAGMVTELVVR